MSNARKQIKRKKKPYLVRLMRKIKRTFRGWEKRNPLRAQNLHIICILFIIIFVVGIVIKMA